MTALDCSSGISDVGAETDQARFAVGRESRRDGTRVPLIVASTGTGPAASTGRTSGDRAREGAAELDRDSEGRLLVAAVVNGKGPLTFLVDTGAPHSVLATKVAIELGLELGTSEANVNFTDFRQVRVATLSRLVLGSALIAGPEFIIADLPSHAGRIGLDLLRTCNAVLDLRSSGILLAAPLPLEEALAGVTVKPALVRVVVEGIGATAIIDTGAPVSAANRSLLAALRRQLASGVRGKGSSGAVLAPAERGEPCIGTPFANALLETNTPSSDATLLFSELGLEDQPALVLGMDVLAGCELLRVGRQGEAILELQGAPDRTVGQSC